jgi:hypothetical protein
LVIYAQDLAVVEALGGRHQVTDPGLIARCGRWLELLRQAYVTGVQAAELCRPISGELAG